MYVDIPLWLSLVMIVGGFAALAWSSDAFVDGSAGIAKALGISPFVIGMVVIGFGTSAPELCVSVMSGLSGHADLSLGNAYGSCIFNIAVILGVSVMVFPLVTRPSVTYVAGPGLAAISLFSMFILRDGSCSRIDAVIMLAAFFILLPLYCWFDQKTKAVGHARSARRKNGKAPEPEPEESASIAVSVVKLVVGLSLLIGSSHVLVWGAVDLAKFIGVSDLVIGLTIVAIGTSLPELASGIASARRGEHEFVLGNIVGSNLFNTLAVVGLACVISPVEKFSPYVLTRDLPLVTFLSLSILLFGVNRRHLRWPGVIKRRHAIAWLVIFVAYTVVMFIQERPNV
jgi:cation:H+ antiporter